MKKEEAEALIQKYITGACTPEEKAIVEQAYADMSGDNRELYGEATYEEISKLNWEQISLKTRTRKPKLIYRVLRYATAASLIMISVYYGYKYLSITSDLTNYKRLSVKNVDDVLPGGNRAYLTLGNGQKIKLDSAKNGISIGASRLSYIDGTQINQAIPIGVIEEQTITTPKGGQYHVILPDGTKVWLNAASSLKYPVTFKERGERKVILSGEAYFDVIHNQSMPFIVVTSAQEIRVLGTKFNISSYSDDGQTVTTLKEGSVQVTTFADKKDAMIIPGQQAITIGDQMRIRSANMEISLAWINGQLTFKSATIEEIMRQVSRWYNVRVVYAGEMPQNKFSGSISRNSNLSSLLSILEFSGIHFKIERNDTENILTILSQ